MVRNRWGETTYWSATIWGATFPDLLLFGASFFLPKAFLIYDITAQVLRLCPRVTLYLDGAHTRDSMKACARWFGGQGGEGGRWAYLYQHIIERSLRQPGSIRASICGIPCQTPSRPCDQIMHSKRIWRYIWLRVIEHWLCIGPMALLGNVLRIKMDDKNWGRGMFCRGQRDLSLLPLYLGERVWRTRFEKILNNFYVSKRNISYRLDSLKPVVPNLPSTTFTHGATCCWLACTIPPPAAITSSSPLKLLHIPPSPPPSAYFPCTRVRGNRHHHQTGSSYIFFCGR